LPCGNTGSIELNDEKPGLLNDEKSRHCFSLQKVKKMPIKFLVISTALALITQETFAYMLKISAFLSNELLGKLHS